MRIPSNVSSSFPRQFAVLTLASAIAIPVWAQQATVNRLRISPRTLLLRQRNSSPPQRLNQPMNTPKEGFWGRVYPFARKKWVKRQTDPSTTG